MNTILAPIGMHVLILAIFYVFYRFVLSRETFFQLNRGVLITGLVASVVMPFFPPTYVAKLESAPETDLSALITMEPVTTPPVEASQAALIGSVLLSIYALVSMFLLFRWLRQLFVLFSEAGNQERLRINGIQIVNTPKYPHPFSCFHLTFIDWARYPEEERSQIIAHEKAHVKQYHWIDLLLVQLLGILAWINPIVWQYEKAMRQNHEFLADEAVLKRGGSRRQYKALILQQMLGGQPVTVVSPLFNNHYKNRFQMMNQKRSNNLNRLKVAGILPLLAMTLWAFAQPVYQTTSEWVSNDITNTDSQQEITVKGKVTDSETGQPIASASVIIVNTTSGTITDNDGNFVIRMPADASLAISYIGYQTEKILVDDETYREIRLAPKYYSPKPVESPVNRTNKPASDEKVISGEVFKIVEALPYYKDPQNQQLFDEVKKATAKYAARSGEKGAVTVGFTVTSSGQVSKVSTIESSNPRLNKVAEEIIQTLKNWEPGKQRGEAVDTLLKLTLVFE